MDHLTADSDVVLASMGGKPRMPEEEFLEDDYVKDSDEGQPSQEVSDEKLSTAERGENGHEVRERSNAGKDDLGV